MNNKTFLELVFLKQKSLEDVSGFVQEWLRMPSREQELHKALGMTVSQYNRWLVSSENLRLIYKEFSKLKQ